MNDNIVVHKEGAPDVVLLSPSGRILTEPFERPDWLPEGAALAGLAARNQFYLTRLGADAAAPLLSSNIVNVLDLDWIVVDDEGIEATVAADDEFRQGMLAAAIGVDRESGAIEAAITDHYIDKTGAVMTAAEVAAEVKEAEERFGKQNQQAQATG